MRLGEPVSLRIQIVLYGTSEPSFLRTVSSLRAALLIGQRHGLVDKAHIAVGDSTREPCLSASVQTEAHHLMREGPGANFSYRHFDENLGSAGGNNTLFGERDEDFVFVLNPDTYAHPDLFLELFRPLVTPDNGDIGLIEARQVPLEHPKYYDPSTGDTSWASGACTAFSRTALDATKGFDAETFFLHCDDVDISWRARLAGFRVIHRPAARVFHDKRLTQDAKVDPSPAELRYSAEGSLLLAWKYGRNDLVDEWLEGLRHSELDLHRDVARTFSERLERGELPPQIDGGLIADFRSNGFGPTRFAYE